MVVSSKIEIFPNMGENKKLKPLPSFSVVSSPLPLQLYFSNNPSKAQTIRSASSKQCLRPRNCQEASILPPSNKPCRGTGSESPFALFCLAGFHTHNHLHKRTKNCMNQVALGKELIKKSIQSHIVLRVYSRVCESLHSPWKTKMVQQRICS